MSLHHSKSINTEAGSLATGEKMTLIDSMIESLSGEIGTMTAEVDRLTLAISERKGAIAALKGMAQPAPSPPTFSLVENAAPHAVRPKKGRFSAAILRLIDSYDRPIAAAEVRRVKPDWMTGNQAIRAVDSLRRRGDIVSVGFGLYEVAR